MEEKVLNQSSTDMFGLNVFIILNYLRLDTTDDEIFTEVSMLYLAVESYIKNYMGQPIDKLLDEQGKLPDEFKVAALLLCSHWYENRSIIAGKYSSPKPVPFTINAILDMHRRWL